MSSPRPACGAIRAGRPGTRPAIARRPRRRWRRSGQAQPTKPTPSCAFSNGNSGGNTRFWKWLTKCAAETSAIAWYSPVLPFAPPAPASASVVIPGPYLRLRLSTWRAATNPATAGSARLRRPITRHRMPTGVPLLTRSRRLRAARQSRIWHSRSRAEPASLCSPTSGARRAATFCWPLISIGLLTVMYSASENRHEMPGRKRLLVGRHILGLGDDTEDQPGLVQRTAPMREVRASRRCGRVRAPVRRRAPRVDATPGVTRIVERRVGEARLELVPAPFVGRNRKEEPAPVAASVMHAQRLDRRLTRRLRPTGSPHSAACTGSRSPITVRQQ